MNLIVWLVVGGVIGWLASLLLRTDGAQGVLFNVVVGIVGSAFGGWFIAPLVGVAGIQQGSFSVGGLLVSLFGAVILLSALIVLRRGSLR
jgi:uncharacterized membrane protein YeaQ/YmgE (transglycosylase-associated protein family)